ncbi:tripartite tricarboxylate transporter TctB family protein [Fusobacterium sp. PH5-44]|uniref:tripartite tricarboxylate transporter TctB family protein n=1 Tax=unclassified Fusobacterium TaxID=2648384 RepID=UPI003D1E7DCA
MNDGKKNFYSGIVFFVFGVFIFLCSYKIPATTSDILGSRFFPRVVSISTCVLSLMLIILSSRNFKKSEESIEVKKSDNKSPLKLISPFSLTIILLFSYYILLNLIGFTLTSILYLFLQSAILMNNDDRKDKKKIVVLGIVSIIIPIFINLIFLKIFDRVLPVGKLF